MRRGVIAGVLVGALGLGRVASAGPTATSTSTEVVDEHLRAEEAWARAEYERKLRVRDGSVEPPIPPPGHTGPLPGRDWLGVLLAIFAGILWGRWHRRRKNRRRKRRR